MMSLLGKYRKEEERRDEEKPPDSPRSSKTRKKTQVRSTPVAVPNKERRSPIMSFSVTSELRSCLQAVRNEKAINLSLWVEKKLREALSDEFPLIADRYLE